MGYIDIANLIIIGKASSGKTLIVQRYSNELQGVIVDPDNMHTDATIGTDITILNVKLDNKMIELKFWDTAGTEKYNSLCQNYYKNADGVLLVYDVTDLDSFHAVHDYFDVVKTICRFGIPITLIANKTDLVSKRIISTKQGKDLANDLKVEYIETSAYTNANVANSVVFTLRKIMQLTGMGYSLKQKDAAESTKQIKRKKYEDKDSRSSQTCNC